MSRSEQLRHIANAVIADRGLETRSLFAITSDEPLHVVRLPSDSRDRPRGSRVVLQLIQPRNLSDHEVRLGQSEFSPHRSPHRPVCRRRLERFELHSIEQHFHSRCRNPLVRDERLSYSLTDGEDSVARSQQQTVTDHTLQLAMIGMLPAMLGEDHRRGVRDDNEAPSRPSHGGEGWT